MLTLELLMDQLLKRFFLFSCLIFFTNWAYAQAGSNGYITGEGQFYSQEDDSQDFVKRQLLFNAFKDVISKELASMGLDEKLFWDKFDTKFENYFVGIKEEEEKRAKKDANKATADAVTLAKESRVKRYNLKVKYGNITRAISSYSIKTMSRSPKVPSSRYMAVSAKVDRKILADIYSNYVRDGDVCHVQNLYVALDFGLENLTWMDIGIVAEGDLVAVLQRYWKQWLEKELKIYVDNVVFVDASLREKISDHLRLSSPNSSSQAATDSAKTKIDGEVGGIEVGENFFNSFYLKMNNVISKISEDKGLKKRKLYFDGDFVIVDMRVNQVIYSYDFNKEEKTFSYANNNVLSSAVASLVYQRPLSQLGSFVKFLKNYPDMVRTLDLSVVGVKDVSELLAVKALLSKFGQNLFFNPFLKQYDGANGTLTLFYHGEEGKITSLIASLVNQKVNIANDVIYLKDEKDPFTLSIRRQ